MSHEQQDNTPGLRTVASTQGLGMLSNTILPPTQDIFMCGMPSTPIPQGFSFIFVNASQRRSAALPSDVSPAALEKSLSGLNLGLHSVEDRDEYPLYFSLPDCRCQNWSSALGFHVVDVVPIGIMDSTFKPSSGSVQVGFARLCWLQVAALAQPSLYLIVLACQP